VVSSKDLARLTGLSDVSVRKDISNFRKVGTPGVGYDAAELKRVLEDHVLNVGVIRVVLFGVGNLGQAVLKYPGFRKDRLKIVAGFDKDKKKIGRTFNGVKIFSVREAPMVVKKKRVHLGIVAVSEDGIQEVRDIIVRSGLKAIINFSPMMLEVPEGVFVKNIDFTIEFLSLYCRAYGMKRFEDDLGSHGK
ncbi:MAG: redox-sensing transcriptional repressor Rex, partial [Candidatus Omnitrophica bacterium]|nr:redox-sensing transcriptional repressor Rex [Candidatus Omnitrophota bacterium]